MGLPALTFVPDFDPEDIDGDVQSSGEEGAAKQSDLSLGREHYQSVGCVK